MPERAPPSNRRLVQRFAAYLAHLMNASGDVVSIQGFELFTRLMSTLERREQGGDSGPYDGLVGLKLLGPGTTPHEAALHYFDHVLRRPLHLARSEPIHKGHALFLALCRRGRDQAWLDAELVRKLPHGATERTDSPADFADVADRLLRLKRDISDGNPAKSTRATAGPLFLRARGACTEVAEELSVWDAITSAPTRLKVLAPGPDFDAFCSAVIKALEAANAPHGTLLALGLSPRDWQELSVNTAKKASVFLGNARSKGTRVPLGAQAADASKRFSSDDTLANWELAWTMHPVPGFASAKDFWDSPLGRALRHSQVPVMVDIEGEAIEDPVGSEAKILDAIAFDRMLALAQQEGALSPFDAWFLRKLSAGETIPGLAGAPETRHALGKNHVSKRMIETYANNLQDRIELYVASRH